MQIVYHCPCKHMLLNGRAPQRPGQRGIQHCSEAALALMHISWTTGHRTALSSHLRLPARAACLRHLLLRAALQLHLPRSLPPTTSTVTAASSALTLASTAPCLHLTRCSPDHLCATLQDYGARLFDSTRQSGRRLRLVGARHDNPSSATTHSTTATPLAFSAAHRTFAFAHCAVAFARCRGSRDGDLDVGGLRRRRRSLRITANDLRHSL
mmetsp:Transcript_5796/g.12202  ORF Transcript_5796/g.12202 Transcript_5796/m.12202 type:complete len:211 (+) Transcript_5796:160-792(+)